MDGSRKDSRVTAKNGRNPARRSIIIPNKREIYPSVVRDCLETMGITEEELLKFFGRMN